MDAERLRAIPLFESLTKAERERIALWADEVDVPEGKRLAEEGEFAHQFFVIVDGTVEVTQGGERLRDLGPQDFFGEIGLLESERRTATVTAKSPVHAIVMFGPHFRSVEHEMPAVAEKIRAAIRERLA